MHHRAREVERDDARAGVAPGEARYRVNLLKQRGQFLLGQPLSLPGEAITVRVRDGKMLTSDGPFVETKEMLAGFYLIEAADDEEAVRIAARIPPAREGTIEVRPVRALEV